MLASLRCPNDRVEYPLSKSDSDRTSGINQQLCQKAVRISSGGESEAKANYVRELGSEHVVSLSQGMNDTGMMREAILGICILSPEGLACETLQAADLVVPDILSALALLENPMRLIASLRQ